MATFYPKSGDDSIYSANATFSTAHNATSGTLRGASANAYVQCSLDTNYTVERYFGVFALSSIGTPTSATLTVRVSAKSGTSARNYAVYGSTCSDPVAAGDFDTGGTTIWSNTRATSDITDGQDLVFTFNSTGLAALADGDFKLCIREVTYDVGNSAPSDACYWAFKDGSNASNKPALTITSPVTTNKALDVTATGTISFVLVKTFSVALSVVSTANTTITRLFTYLKTLSVTYPTKNSSSLTYPDKNSSNLTYPDKN